jgi:hypothetical protein
MNFLGHHEVARRLLSEQDTEFNLGAMLPDFAGMFGHRGILSDIANQRVVEGIKLHHETDRLFDDLEEVKAIETDMHASLKTFMPKWPASQCARAGKDMLFDGLYVRDAVAMASYQRTMRAAAAGRVALGEQPYRSDFWDKLRRLQSNGIPEYDDPHVVAVRLHARLSITRINFSADLIPQLAGVLAEHQPRVFRIGPMVMEQVIGAIGV